ncbi:uroporphyrinogen-III synthase [Octadecabacter sp.]|nr:uroporphyrinogen-III synthase [Octadecabacter sp.]
MTLPQSETPTVLITRPAAAAERFRAALEKSAGPFRSLILPAFEIVSFGVSIPDFDMAIFTSRAGVAFAPKGRDRVAFCVGDATSEAAMRSGYRAHSAQGSASDLCQVILAQAPLGKLLHIRGEVSLGDVMATLSAGGLHCSEVVAYRKDPARPDREILNTIAEVKNLIIPLFSAETVSIIGSWDIDFGSAMTVSISSAVGHAAVVLNPAEIVVADAPNLPSMVASTARLIA